MYDLLMARTSIDLDDQLIWRARRVTRLRTKKAIVHRALENFGRTEARKGILKFYGSAIWQGDLKAMRRSRRP
jgi:Arc/MetJ family transcription regulator